MDDLEVYKRIGLALAIGLVIGIERGWHTRTESAGLRIAGVRSFALIGLLGGFAGVLSASLGPLLPGAVVLALGALLGTAYVLRLRVERDYGITTEITALLTLLLGFLAARGDMILAATGAIVTAALLALKPALHRWIRHVERLELSAGLQLLIISVVVLPLLPDRGFGPGQALNPYELWWIVVLIAGLSFLGYVAIRLMGPKSGALLTGLFGGLVGSTGIAVAFARMGKRSRQLQPVLATGVMIAASVMFLRLLLIVGLLNERMVPRLAWPLGLMAVAGFGAAAVAYATGGADPEQDSATEPASLTNPLELPMALQFGAILAVVVVLAELVRRWLGDQGLYLLAGIAGLTDVDAIAVSVARQASKDLAAGIAATAVTIAAFVNTAIKGGIVGVICGGGMARRTGLAFAVVIAAGAVGLLLPGIV